MKNILEHLDTKLFRNGIESGVIAIVICIILSISLKIVLDKFIDKQNWKQKVFIKKIKNVVISILFTIGVLSQFSFMDSLMNTVLASGGIVAVVIGLASQEAASNLVGGMMILVSKPFEIGDIIILKETNLRGEVKDITLGHTIIETLDKNLIMIPNTTINKTIIENLTQSQADFKVAYISFEISYDSDIDKASQIMKNIAMNHPLFYPINSDMNQNLAVHCMGFKNNGVTLRLKATTRNIDDNFVLSSDCRILIKKAFDENGIKIPLIPFKSED